MPTSVKQAYSISVNATTRVSCFHAACDLAPMTLMKSLDTSASLRYTPSPLNQTKKITMLSCKWVNAMPARFRLRCWLWLGLLTLYGTTGCVERRMVIATDPYGAIVYDEKNIPIGA